MKKKSSSQSAFFNPRIFAASLLCLLGASVGWIAFAATTPVSGTLSTSNRSLTYTDPVGAPPNLTGFALGNPNCGPSDALCSVFTLTIDSSIGTAAAGYDPTQYQIAIQWSWAVPLVDYDIFIKNSAGSLVAKNQSTADPSTIVLPTNLPAGDYKLVVVLSTGAPIAYTATVNLERVPAGPGLCNPAITNCASPRFQNFPAGPGQAEDAGEPSIGVDWNPNVASMKHDQVNTGGVAFFTSSNHEWRVNFDDCSSPAIYNWQDVSAVFDQTAPLADPIGFVDHYSNVELGLSYPPPHTPGRVFCLQLLGGQGNSLGAFSDDDGTSYLPGANGGPGQGPDHETLGGGPYSGTAPSTASYPATGAKHAIYYCSQNIVAEAQCSRSDDGGQTFGPGIPIFSPNQCTGGTTGHAKVAPDGTVYVANSSCGTTGTTGVAVSTDNGLTWTENNITDSTSSQDPYISIGQNNVGKPIGQAVNTIYLSYVDGNGHAKVAFSGDRGVHWSTPVDVGAPFGVTHAVFPIAAAGDDDRAAVGFLGTGDGIATTGTCNPYGAVLNCKNIWHLYVATTYDGGQSWITTDATPNDPVQTGTICLEGTTCAGGRNLADFNDMAIDAEGRILVGFADGCPNCSNTFSGQSSSSHGTVTRQSGGRRLFAYFDPTEPAPPAPPQMISATQSGTSALVQWLEPDNGGSPITGYKVYRGTSSGTETFLANVSGATTNKYFDPSPPSAPAVFNYVTAVNANGESSHCREVVLGVAPTAGNSCTFPYKNVDPAGGPGTAPDVTPNKSLTIEYVNLGEPFLNCSDNSITYLMKVKSLDATGTGTAVLPENAEYQIVFSITGTDNNPHTVYVELDTFAPNSQALPGVSIGRRDPCTAGCGTLDSSISANIVTATYSADGTIQLKLDASGPIVFAAPTAPGTGTAFTWDARNAGVSMASIVGNTQLFVGAGAGFLETVSVTSGGSYTRVGNNSCSSGLPTARLTASTQAGGAPLSVNFDGATSSDPAPCVAVTSYTLNFGDGSAPVTQASPMFNHTYTTAGDYPARLTVKDANGNTSTNPAQVIITVTGGTVPLSGVVSRKTHTGLGDFDIVMPGIECRNGGSQGSHTLIAAFDNTLTSVSSATATATTSSGTQSVTVLGTSGIGTNNHQFIVNLSGVPNASHVAVTLHGVTDSASNTGDVVLNGDFLLGDTTANGAVNASDIAQTQSESGHSVSSSNFREDVTVNGALNSSDIATVQAQSGTALPAAPAQTTTPPSTAPGTAPASAPPSKRQPKHKARPRSAGSF